MPQIKPFYNFRAVSETETDLIIYGVIGPDYWDEGNMAKKFVADFKAAEEKYKRINIRINSPGGYIAEGLPMFNAIAQSKAEVHTYNDGIAYSMGAIILLAAPKGNIHAAKNSLMLLHAPLSGAAGNARDLRNVANELDKYGEVLISVVADKTGIATEKVKSDWFNYDDHLLTSAEAQKLGLVDDLIEVNGKVPQNVSALSISQVMNLYDSGFAEDSFVEKIRNLFTEFLPKNLTNTMKRKFLNLSRYFATDIESVDGKATITDDVLDKIEAIIPQLEASATALTAAQCERDAVIAERDQANETITARDARIAELEAEVSRLQGAAGASSATTVVETEVTNETGSKPLVSDDDDMASAIAKVKESYL